MTATIQTLDTPDGAFTLLVDERQRVLASGWTAEPAAILARLRTPPSDVREGTVDAAAAVTAYYDGDLGAIDGIEVHQIGTALQRAGWHARTMGARCVGACPCGGWILRAFAIGHRLSHLHARRYRRLDKPHPGYRGVRGQRRPLRHRDRP